MGMSKKKAAIIKLILSIVIIAGLLYVVFFGLTITSTFKVPSVLDKNAGVRLGLDLTGGSVIVYQADTDTTPTTDQMNSAIAKIRARLGTAFSEATVSKEGTNRIRVEIPSISNPEDAESMLGTTGKITFTDMNGNVLMDGTDQYISKAEYYYGTAGSDSTPQNNVKLTFTAAGQAAFKAATQAVLAMPSGQQYMPIMLDSTVISEPQVTQVIDSDTALITYGTTSSATDVKYDADVINSGRLPFALTPVQSQSIGATLGDKALSSSLLAGGIGIILILLLMAGFYRVPGLLADLALLGYIGIILAIYTAMRLNLSLPGIAGVILSIGMAVDANVLIFERLKEELALGKSVSSAVNAGFKHAWTAIFDSNVTTLIVALALYLKGTSTIQSFAITLAIGVVVSMLTAITFTRFLFKLLAKLEVKNPKLYGMPKGGTINV